MRPSVSIARIVKACAVALVLSTASTGCVVAGGYRHDPYDDRGAYERYDRHDRGYNGRGHARGWERHPHFYPQWGPPPVVYARPPVVYAPRPLYAPAPSFNLVVPLNIR